MASIDPSLISDPREQKWVGEISEILKHQLEINVEIPPVSIFKIPETITTNKPEAYQPQQIGFGPYHHFQPGTYTKMEHKKLVVLQRVLQDHKIKDFTLTVLDKVQKLVPVIRACYETFLQDDNVSMAWVFAIDGLFLLNLFQTYDTKQPKVDPTKRLLAQDILMVENQIPFLVLKEINEALHTSSGNNFPPSMLESMSVEEEILLGQPSSKPFSPNSIFRSFCEIHSPLEMCSPSQAPTHVQHLLDFMYRSIINNDPPEKVYRKFPEFQTFSKKFVDVMYRLFITFTTWPPVMCYSSMKLTADPFFQASNFLNKVPQKEIVQLYEQTITSLQHFSSNKITIPSASKIQGGTRFRFHKLPKDGGVKTVWIDDENKFYLPCITLNNDSQVILRNLVAYETLIPNSNHHPLTEYMGLMCGLIVNVEDVKIFKQVNIIKGELSDDNVAKMFDEMSSSIMSLKNKEKSELQELIDEVNKVYESRPRIKVYLFMKKLANWLLVVLKKIGSFVGATWKIVAFMISIVTVFMLTYQAYCDVYGCDTKSVALLSYASS